MEQENLLDLGLKGKIVVLTGAAMGIGKSLLNLFDHADCNVAAVDIERVELFKAIGELKNPEKHMALIKDLESSEDCESIANEVKERYGRIDILVNNAGILFRVPTSDVTLEMWKKVGDINLRSQFLLCRSIGDVMKKNNFGRIINFSSQGYFTGGFDHSLVYSAFKGATVTMSKGFARQLAPFGINVNIIAPGPVDTRMMASVSKERLSQFLAETVLLKRSARPNEIALSAIFLASKWADYITGFTMDVNGGVFMK
jgi:NAD(P)-dependent dehydrogenase (short-subunit alcohol dehydrogenase family)